MEEKIIAIPMAEGKLSMHFGHCQTFGFFTVKDNVIVGKKEIEPPAHQPGVYPKWVREQQAELVIAGGMGVRAQELFRDAGVDLLLGAPGIEAEKVVQAHLDGTLEQGENACDH